MRTEGQTRYQLKQVIFRHLQKELRENFKKRPETCNLYRALFLDGGCIGLCGTEALAAPHPLPCDSRLPGGLDKARECPYWEPVKTKDQIKAEFGALISGDRGVLAGKYPDVAALLWVLDAPGELALVEIPVEPEPEPVLDPWWQRVWDKIRGVR